VGRESKGTEERRGKSKKKTANSKNSRAPLTGDHRTSKRGPGRRGNPVDFVASKGGTRSREKGDE